MRALLLAAGLGTRLRPITDTLPKCLVPIRDRPLLDYWFDLLLPGSVERILVNTCHLPDQVRAHVAASQWRDAIDLVHEESLLGTGGTVLANRDWFGPGPFLVAHADNLTDFDAAALVRAHAARPAGCAITMLAFRTDAPRLCGILELDGAGVVRQFQRRWTIRPAIWRTPPFISSSPRWWIGSPRWASRWWTCRPRSSRVSSGGFSRSSIAAITGTSAMSKAWSGRIGNTLA